MHAYSTIVREMCQMSNLDHKSNIETQIILYIENVYAASFLCPTQHSLKTS